MELLNAPKTAGRVAAALAAADEYLATRALDLFAPILGHLSEVGEARACREIEDHFRRTFGVDGVTTACEYLADRQRARLRHRAPYGSGVVSVLGLRIGRTSGAKPMTQTLVERCGNGRRN